MKISTKKWPSYYLERLSEVHTAEAREAEIAMKKAISAGATEFHAAQFKKQLPKDHVSFEILFQEAVSLAVIALEGS